MKVHKIAVTLFHRFYLMNITLQMVDRVEIGRLDWILRTVGKLPELAAGKINSYH